MKKKFLTFVLLLIFTQFALPADRLVELDFGGFAISEELYDYILEILPKGKTVLELGSGAGTEELLKNYTVYSVEHDTNWLDKFPTNYIYAPIKDGWYDTQELKKKLPTKYDLILVDGPTGKIGRRGFLKHINLFNTNVPIVFDDIHREAENKLMEDTANYLGRTFFIPPQKSDKRKFGVILPA